MIKTKRKIIMTEGHLVEVINFKTGEVVTTTALVGRASKQFNSTVSLETQRRAYILPEVTIDSGYILKDLVTGDAHVVIANYDEIIQGKKASTVCHMVRCNALVTISGEVLTADENGNLKKSNAVKYTDMPVYAQGITFDLIQFQPGLQEDVKYILHAPGVDVDILDHISVTVDGRDIPLKATTTDYISYPGLVLIQVHTETR